MTTPRNTSYAQPCIVLTDGGQKSCIYVPISTFPVFWFFYNNWACGPSDTITYFLIAPLLIACMRVFEATTKKCIYLLVINL